MSLQNEISRTIDDIDEMVREKYICSLGAYDEALEDYEITWTNSSGRECGFHGSRHLINRMFTEALLN